LQISFAVLTVCQTVNIANQEISNVMLFIFTADYYLFV